MPLPNEVFADLQFPRVNRTNTGSYTCVASNSFGTTRSTGHLIVQCEWPRGEGEGRGGEEEGGEEEGEGRDGEGEGRGRGGGGK